MSTALLARPATDDRAFERLYRRHVHEVYRYVLAVLRNQADAEDATQATFLNAYRAFLRGDEPQKPRNWLLKIAHNECRQRFRAAARRPREVEWDERTPAPALDETVPSADEIRTALAHLSFNQRSALVMRELEGRSYAEIATILDLSVSAVETLLFRARRALREQLEGALTCGEAEATLSRRLDGRISLADQRALRAHLRECRECALLERKQRARRAAFKRLGVVQLPPSLASFLGGTGSVTGGAIAGSGLVAKAAAMVAAGVVAGGVGHEAVQAVAADNPTRTPPPELRRVPTRSPATLRVLQAQATRVVVVRSGTRTITVASPGETTHRARGAVQSALDREHAAADSSPAPDGGETATPAKPHAGVEPPGAPPAAQEAADAAKDVVPNVPNVKPPEPSVPPAPELPVQLPVPPLPPLPLPPPPPLLP